MACCNERKSSVLEVVDEAPPVEIPLSEQLTKGIKVVVLGEMATGPHRPR